MEGRRLSEGAGQGARAVIKLTMLDCDWENILKAEEAFAQYH